VVPGDKQGVARSVGRQAREHVLWQVRRRGGAEGSRNGRVTDEGNGHVTDETSRGLGDAWRKRELPDVPRRAIQWVGRERGARGASGGGAGRGAASDNASRRSGGEAENAHSNARPFQ